MFPRSSLFEGEVTVSAYDLVDLHVNNEDLGNILQLLSIQSERNIVTSNEVNASVTADLYGVTFYEALDAILHANGFGYIERGNFIYVYTREELETMCARINGLRSDLRVALEKASGRDFAFIEREKGMFSFLGLAPEQAQRLREEFSVYMLDSSRINVAGVNAGNIDYLAQSVAKVL